MHTFTVLEPSQPVDISPSDGPVIPDGQAIPLAARICIYGGIAAAKFHTYLCQDTSLNQVLSDFLNKSNC